MNRIVEESIALIREVTKEAPRFIDDVGLVLERAKQPMSRILVAYEFHRMGDWLRNQIIDQTPKNLFVSIARHRIELKNSTVIDFVCLDRSERFRGLRWDAVYIQSYPL
jgi:hypothetical protein